MIFKSLMFLRSAMTLLVDRARELAPALLQRSAELDHARRLPADLAQTLAGQGFMTMLLPVEYGGAELSPLELVEVLEALGAIEGAVGWCSMIASTTTINAAYLPHAQASLIWNRPDVITGGVFAPRGTATIEGDHLRVTGQWPWGSGSANCDWLLGGVLVLGPDGKPRMTAAGRVDARMAWFPKADVTLIDTWHTLGMRGTGSGDLKVDNVLVPYERTVSLVEDKPRIDRPLYAFPAFGLLALGIAGVALGIARGAVDDLMELAGAKVPVGARKPVAHRPATQSALGEAEASLRAAKAFVHDEAGKAWEAASNNGSLSLKDRAGLRMAATHAVRTSAAVVRSMHDLAGGTSVYENSPLERRFRDIHVATQHIMVAPGTWEQAGRALLGLDGDYGTL
jgi:indole-3-acetate monooxygenase